jgi:ribosomal protein L37AE/L43A
MVIPMFACPICETHRTERAGVLCWDCAEITRGWTKLEWRQLQRRQAEAALRRLRGE